MTTDRTQPATVPDSPAATCRLSAAECQGRWHPEWHTGARGPADTRPDSPTILGRALLADGYVFLYDGATGRWGRGDGQWWWNREAVEQAFGDVQEVDLVSPLVARVLQAAQQRVAHIHESSAKSGVRPEVWADEDELELIAAVDALGDQPAEPAPVEVLEDALCRRVWAAALRWAAPLAGADPQTAPRTVLRALAQEIESGTLTPWDDQPAEHRHCRRTWYRNVYAAANAGVPPDRHSCRMWDEGHPGSCRCCCGDEADAGPTANLAAASHGLATDATPEPAAGTPGDGPGWQREVIDRIIADARAGHLPPEYVLSPEDADQVQALLADRDQWREGALASQGQRIRREAVDSAMAEVGRLVQERDTARAELAEVTAERDRQAEAVQQLQDTHGAILDAIPREPDLGRMTLVEAVRQVVTDRLAARTEPEEAKRLHESDVSAWRAEADRLRAELRDAGNDLLDIRGILSPNGQPRRVPDHVPMASFAAPAVAWLADEVERLRGLVGDENQPGWDGCSRAEAIRQANEAHEFGMRMLNALETVKAEVATARQALGDIASLAATATPDDRAGTFDRLQGIVRLAQEAARPTVGSPEPAEGGGDDG